jgi:predicted  nucleic acid-binding Zn-ribbon protein
VINDLRSENDIEKSRTSSLEDSLREFEAEVEQMRQAFTNELHNK